MPTSPAVAARAIDSAERIILATSASFGANAPVGFFAEAMRPAAECAAKDHARQASMHEGIIFAMGI
eukprot:9472865-Karenia_brevis.AAC.1